MKLIFQIVGFLVLVIILVSLVLFFLDNYSFLSGDFALYIRSVHEKIKEIQSLTVNFMKNSGIAEDAADLLDQGADMLRSSSPEPMGTPSPEENVGEIVIEAVPTETPPAIIIITPYN